MAKKFTVPHDTSSDYVYETHMKYLEFYNIPVGKSVVFKSFLTDFEDRYQSKWNSEEVYGRMDPIQTFQGTSRIISLGWDVVASSFQEAKVNLSKATLLYKMLYPVYTKTEGADLLGSAATVLAAAPLFKLKFLNMVQDSAYGAAAQGSAETGGLIGTISGFTYKPDIDQGFFEDPKASGTQVGAVYPQTIALSCEYVVQHEHGVGWYKTGDGVVFGNAGFGEEVSTFPYGLDDTYVDSGGRHKVLRTKKRIKNQKQSKGVSGTSQKAAENNTPKNNAAKAKVLSPRKK